MNKDEEERDRAIDKLSETLADEDLAVAVWGASRKHRDAEIEVLKEALAHYADKSNWRQSEQSMAFDESADDVVGGNAPHFKDTFKTGNGYEIAEKALEQLREGTNV